LEETDLTAQDKNLTFIKKSVFFKGVSYALYKVNSEFYAMVQAVTVVKQILTLPRNRMYWACDHEVSGNQRQRQKSLVGMPFATFSLYSSVWYIEDLIMVLICHFPE
jgi:hypothetical protein